MIPKKMQKCGLCRKYSHANVKCYHDYSGHAFRAPQSHCDYPDFGWSAVEWVEKDLTELFGQIVKMQKAAEESKKVIALECKEDFGCHWCESCNDRHLCKALAELDAP